MFSLVDKRAGFSNPVIVGSNPGSVSFFPFFKYIESVWVQILPPHTHICFNFLNIVQYLFVHSGERGGLVVYASDSGSRGRGFEPHSGQTVLCP